MSALKTGKSGVSGKAYSIFSRIRSLRSKEVNNMLYSLKRFSENEIAPQRMKIIKFYDQYGERAVKEAFGADRKVVSRWKQRLVKSQGKLSSLIPLSTRPHKIRTSQIDSRITAFIKKQRKDHPRIGKEKLKPDLDIYCRQLGISTISISTVGNIIKRNQFFFQKPIIRVYHDPNSAWARKAVKYKKRLRIKHVIRPQDYGHIVSDTVERVTDGIKDYFMNAIDAKMKFALSLNYPNNNSVNMKDFYFRFKKVYPGEIEKWQSDNGKENLGVFDQQLEKDGIPHLFIYPNCPQIDTFIERYNRTLQEEFIDYHLDVIHDKPLFNKKLADWNIYYNVERRHHSLGLISPLNYFVEKGGMSHKYLTYTKN